MPTAALVQTMSKVGIDLDIVLCGTYVNWVLVLK